MTPKEKLEKINKKNNLSETVNIRVDKEMYEFLEQYGSNKGEMIRKLIRKLIRQRAEMDRLIMKNK